MKSPNIGVVATTLIFSVTSVTSLEVSTISKGVSSSTVPQDTKNIANVNKATLNIYFNFIKYSFFNY